MIFDKYLTSIMKSNQKVNGFYKKCKARGHAIHMLYDFCKTRQMSKVKLQWINVPTNTLQKFESIFTWFIKT